MNSAEELRNNPKLLRIKAPAVLTKEEEEMIKYIQKMESDYVKYMKGAGGQPLLGIRERTKRVRSMITQVALKIIENSTTPGRFNLGDKDILIALFDAHNAYMKLFFNRLGEIGSVAEATKVPTIETLITISTITLYKAAREDLSTTTLNDVIARMSDLGSHMDRLSAKLDISSGNISTGKNTRKIRRYAGFDPADLKLLKKLFKEYKEYMELLFRFFGPKTRPKKGSIYSYTSRKPQVHNNNSNEDSA